MSGKPLTDVAAVAATHAQFNGQPYAVSYYFPNGDILTFSSTDLKRLTLSHTYPEPAPIP